MILSDISNLSKTSKEKIEVVCTICNNVSTITYYSYNRNIKRGGFFSCKSCSSIKRKKTMMYRYGVENSMFSIEVKDKIKKTNLERYGVENVFQSEVIKDKIKETNLERYGDECSLNSEVIKDKIKKTNLQRYGEPHHMMSDISKEKIKKTNLRRYGVENVFQSDVVINKIKKSNLEKYGVACSLNSDAVKEKIRQTNLEKYGKEHHMKSSIIKEKIRQTNLEKYGVDSYFKSEEYHLNTNIGNDDYYIKYIGDNKSLFSCDNNHEFSIHIDNYIGRKKKNIPLCTVCNPIGDSKSIKEKELFNFIESIYVGKIIQSYRDVLEIDIYLPELKLGFEFNGLYWHSEEFKDKNYHLKKTNYFKDKGIRIIHIWEDDWSFKREIMESQIKNWLGLTENKIFARKCEVREVNKSDCLDFLNENHIQGNVRSNLKLGLYYNDELVSLMVFDHFEGRKKMGDNEWNLSRFCNKLNTNVVGGASKLLNHFLENFKPNRIVSYADRDWSMGDLYKKLGFKIINKSNPDYKYIVGSKRVHKSRYKKDNLNLGDKTKFTESQVMSKLGIYKVYDCGKIKFEKVYETHK